MEFLELERRWRGHVPQPLGERGRNAVLVPLVEREEGLSLLFQVRADTLRRQPGEVCFPGGKMEPGETPEQTALRETEEELGIPASAVHIIAPMDYLVHQGCFIMYPVLGRVDADAVERMRLSPDEVKETFFVPVDFFVANPPRLFAWDMVAQVPDDFPYEIIGRPRGYEWRRGRTEVPVYHYEGHIIWGLTGRVVRALAEGPNAP